jgi:glycosyltransferase involved in cell wall biosynthesis/trans-aconitate methyltransferase
MEQPDDPERTDEPLAQEPAVVLVRNAVRHDARILREAHTLEDAGFHVLVVGVRTDRDPQPELELEGIRVVRVEPGAGLRRMMRRVRRRGSVGAVAAPAGMGDPPAPVRSPAWRPGRASGARRLAVTSLYYAAAIRLVLRSRPALVHANDYNTMWIGIAAKLLHGSRLIYDSHELWPDRNGRPEWRQWLVACEALFVRIADEVITTSPGYATAIARRYRVPEPTLVRNIPPATAVAAAPRNGAAPVCAYLGAVTTGRGLEQAIQALPQVPALRLVITGPGRDAYVNDLHALAERAGVADRVELRPAVEPSLAVEAVADAAFGLLLIQPICLSYELTLPNKLFEYAAAGLPMLASDLEVIGRVVRQEQLGEVVPPDEIGAIAAGMRRLLDSSVNELTRERVRTFTAAHTWEAEREVLRRVYRTAEHERVARIYGRYAASAGKHRSWDAGNEGNVAIRDELVQAVFECAGAELRTAEAILDIGCGTGWWLERLSADSSISARLLGLDVQPQRAQAAQARVQSAEIVIGDARKLPFDPGRFDVVTLFTTLSSLASRRDAKLALDEAVRVLRPGGVLLVWEPRIRNIFNPSTIFIDARLLDELASTGELSERALTLVPPLARRLGQRADHLYPRLARVPALRTHRLIRVEHGG